MVSLDEEINFARTYIELLKYRFEDSIIFHLNIEDDNSKDFVVPLSLQLLLENCIKHNHATSAKPLQVEIFAKEGYLIIKTIFRRESSQTKNQV